MTRALVGCGNEVSVKSEKKIIENHLPWLALVQVVPGLKSPGGRRVFPLEILADAASEPPSRRRRGEAREGWEDVDRWRPRVVDTAAWLP